MNVKINFEKLLSDETEEGCTLLGGCIVDSVKNTGEAEVVIDIDAMFNVATENNDVSFKNLFTDTIVHEIMHGIEELFERSIDEDAVEEAILKAKESKPDNYNEWDLRYMENFSEFVTDAHLGGDLSLSRLRELSVKVIEDILKANTFIKGLSAQDARS